MSDNGILRVEPTGPYRATKLWNDVLRSFRAGMPTKRHRRFMRNYDNCFTPLEAVTWLHLHLQENPIFGRNVTRQQVTQLLEKFLKAGVFQDIRGSKYNKDFSDNGHLYRFVSSSPMTSLAPRTPLRVCSTNIPPPGPRIDYSHKKMKPVTCLPADGLPECRLMAKPLTPGEVELIWKEVTLSKLCSILGLRTLSELTEVEEVKAEHIVHNLTHVNKQGIVTNIQPDDDLPHWVLSAMRCLANWPQSTTMGLPNYPGFEKDVFELLRDYISQQDGPLIPSNLYTLFTSSLVMAEWIDYRQRGSTDNSMVSERSSSNNNLIPSLESVENLMYNMTCYNKNNPWGRSLSMMSLKPDETSLSRMSIDSYSRCSRPDIQPYSNINTENGGKSIFTRSMSLTIQNPETYAEARSKILEKRHGPLWQHNRKSFALLPRDGCVNSYDPPSCNIDCDEKKSKVSQADTTKPVNLSHKTEKVLQEVKTCPVKKPHHHYSSASKISSDRLSLTESAVSTNTTKQGFTNSNSSYIDKAGSTKQHGVNSMQINNQMPSTVSVNSFLSNLTSADEYYVDCDCVRLGIPKPDCSFCNDDAAGLNNAVLLSSSQGNSSLSSYTTAKTSQADMSCSPNSVDRMCSFKSSRMTNSVHGIDGLKALDDTSIKKSISTTMIPATDCRSDVLPVTRYGLAEHESLSSRKQQSQRGQLKFGNASSRQSTADDNLRPGDFPEPEYVNIDEYRAAAFGETAKPPSDNDNVCMSKPENAHSLQRSSSFRQAVETPGKSRIPIRQHQTPSKLSNSVPRNQHLSVQMESPKVTAREQRGKAIRKPTPSKLSKKKHADNRDINGKHIKQTPKKLTRSNVAKATSTPALSTASNRTIYIGETVNPYSSKENMASSMHGEEVTCVRPVTNSAHPFGSSKSSSSLLKVVGARRKPIQRTSSKKDASGDLTNSEDDTISVRHSYCNSFGGTDSRPPSRSFSRVSSGMYTPFGTRDVMAALKRMDSTPALYTADGTNCAKEALQICCLLLPPAGRKRLQLLLRMMSKMSNNEDLDGLDEFTSVRSLVVETFTNAILQAECMADQDLLLNLRLVTFMMDNYSDIFAIPLDLKVRIQEKLAQSRTSKIQVVYGVEDPTALTYCDQVTREEYAQQSDSLSKKALADLLGGIVNNSKMTLKEKRKKLRQFKESYPDIYKQRFPTQLSESVFFPPETSAKPPILRKLRNLRL